MRYRAFGPTRRSVSALTLSFGRGASPDKVRALAHAGLEVGVNAFELRSADPAAAAALGQALVMEDRAILAVMLRLGGDAGDLRGGGRAPRLFGRDQIVAAVESSLSAGGFGRFDLVLLDDPRAGEVTTETFPALEAMRDAGRATLVGVSGEGAAVDEGLRSARLDVLSTTYNLRSGWPQRNRLKSASEAGLTLVGERFQPDLRPGADAPAASGPGRRLGDLFRIGRRPPPPEADGYAFLQRTPGWRADEICLAYALTEPSLSSVLVEATDAAEVARLGAVPDRDLPAGVAAQIEMARFSAAGREDATAAP